MRRKIFITMLGVGCVSFGAFSFFAGKAILGLCTTYYASHSTYKPMPRDQVKQQKSFVVLITGNNCEEYVEKNLRSVLEQNYEKARIVYIDNASKDRTYYKANEWLRRYSKNMQSSIVRNQERKPETELLYNTVQSFENDEIVVLLDGKDWFSHKEVLSELNAYYNDEHVWLTYSQFATFPEYERGDARSSILNTKKQIGLRSAPWIYSQYSTFYAGLFKRIKMRDLLYEGEFFQYKSNRAIMMPMLEMAEDHAVFIPDILYVNNQEKTIERSSDEIKNIRLYSRHIRGLRPYSKLKDHPKKELVNEQEADLFVFSSDRPMQLYSFLETQRKYTEKIFDIYAVYSASESKYDQGYELVKKHFPEVCFLKQSPSQSDFKQNVISLVKKATSAHVVIAEDQLFLKDQLEVGRAIALLEKTGGYGFYFSLGLNLIQTPEKFHSLSEDAIAWQFKEGVAEWNQSNSFGMVLYRKNEVLQGISTISFNSIDEFKQAWNAKNNTGELGLCFSTSRSLVNVFEIFRAKKGERELLYSQEELNELFLNGMKIDTTPINRYRNKEAKVEMIPNFVAR